MKTPKEEERAFRERIQQDRVPHFLPYSTRRRIENAVRTAIIACLCIVSSNYWLWAGPVTYISSTLAPMSTTLYIGHWIENMWKISYSCVVGSVVGSIVGLTWSNVELQLSLLLISLIWINKCSLWDRLCKVIGGLCLIIGVLLPNLTNGVVSGTKCCSYILAMIMIPFLLTGLAFLLIPYPSFAFNSVQAKIAIISRKLSAAVFAITRAYCASEHVDLLNTEVEFLLNDIEDNLDTLMPLIGYARLELIFLKSSFNFASAAEVFVGNARAMVVEIRDISTALEKQTINKTQAKFVRNMHLYLMDVSDEIDLMLGLVSRRFCAVSLLPQWLHNFVSVHVWSSASLIWGVGALGVTEADIKWREHVHHHRFRHRAVSETPRYLDNGKLDLLNIGRQPVVVADGDESWDNSSDMTGENSASMRIEYQDAVERLSSACDKMLIGYQKTRLKLFGQTRRLFFRKSKRPSESFGGAGPGAFERESSSRKYFREQSPELDSLLTPPPDDTPRSEIVNVDAQMEEDEEDDDEDAALQLLEENNQLSTENFGPRASFVCRLLALKDLVVKTEAVFTAKVEAYNLFALSWGTVLVVYTYFYSCITEVKVVYCLLRSYFMGVSLDGRPESAPGLEQASSFLLLGKKTDIEQSEDGDEEDDKDDEDSIAEGKESDDLVQDSSGRTAHKSLDQMESGAADSIHDWKQHNRLYARKHILKYLKSYIQAIKISGAITLTSVFVVVPQIGSKSYLFTQNALWATVVIALVRQESTASSFLQAYQRVEGTLIGALFAFAVFQFLDCSSNVQSHCAIDKTAPLLVSWMGVCAFFREGPRHGYAATVAALTPVILLLGPTTGTVEGAWLRVMMTFLGIFIYLIIDNSVFPNRTDTTVRRSVIHSVEDTSQFFENSVKALKVLCDVCDYESFSRHVQLEAGKVVYPPPVAAPGPSSTPNASVVPPSPPSPLPPPSTSPPLSPAASRPQPLGPLDHRDDGNGDGVLNGTHDQGLELIPGTTRMTRAVSAPEALSPPQHVTMLTRVRNFSMSGQPMLEVNEASFSPLPPSISNHPASLSINPPLSPSRSPFTPLPPPLAHPSSLQVHTTKPHDAVVGTPESASSATPSSPSRRRPVPGSDSPAGRKLTRDNELDDHRRKLAEAREQCEREQQHEQQSIDIMTISANSKVYIVEAEKYLANLSKNIKLQKERLNIGIFEPEIFKRPFPLQEYTILLSAFVAVQHSGRSVLNSTITLNHTFIDMVRGTVYADVSHHLDAFGFMCRHLFDVSAKADVALKAAAKALHLLFEKDDIDTNLSDLVVLARSCSQLRRVCEDHFRNVYTKYVSIHTLDPLFLVSFQNVLQCINAMIRDLSALGTALHRIRDVEAKAAT